MVRYLEERTPVEFSAWSLPDYHLTLEGARMGGRSIEPAPFDKNQLGGWADKLRASPTFMLPATMQEMTFKYQSHIRPANLPMDEMVQRLEQGVLTAGNALVGRLLKGCLDREIPIHVLIETHGALREVWEIAAASWMQVIDFGLMDFISSHHGAIPASAMRSPGQFDHRLLSRAKGEIAAAALANGLIPAHNVTLDLKNREVTYNDARRARSEFGFLRMWSIYPAQIEPIVDAMKPDYDEVQDAAAILLEAQACDWGPIQYQGELQDRASYRYFWDLLRKARVTGVALPDAAQEAFFNDQS